MALFDFIEKICTALDKNKHAMEMFLGLSKPFDTVNHQILPSKLY